MAFRSDLDRFFTQKTEFAWRNEVVIVNKTLIAVEGHKGLAFVSETDVKMRLKGGGVHIVGEHLQVQEATENQVMILGKINSVNFYE